MNSNEIKAKLDASKDKVEKRINTLKKICKSLNVDSEAVIDDFHTIDTNKEYLPHKEADTIVSKYVTEKETKVLSDEEYWKVCDFNDKISSLSDNLCKLFDVEKVAKNWQIRYDTQLNKENVKKVEVLWNFLTNWENKAYEWYIDNLNEYLNGLNKFKDISYKYIIENNLNEADYSERQNAINKFNEYIESQFKYISKKSKYLSNYPYSAYDYADRYCPLEALNEKLADIRFITDDSFPYDRIFGNLEHSGNYYLARFDYDALKKIIAEEKLRKYNDLCNRISDVVGEITDAHCLSIGDKSGELNGIVIGTKGRAKIETIGAAGYNIQRFHYRVLVHKISD